MSQLPQRPDLKRLGQGDFGIRGRLRDDDRDDDREWSHSDPRTAKICEKHQDIYRRAVAPLLANAKAQSIKDHAELEHTREIAEAAQRKADAAQKNR